MRSKLSRSPICFAKFLFSSIVKNDAQIVSGTVWDGKFLWISMAMLTIRSGTLLCNVSSHCDNDEMIADKYRVGVTLTIFIFPSRCEAMVGWDYSTTNHAHVHQNDWKRVQYNSIYNHMISERNSRDIVKVWVHHIFTFQP